MVADYTKVLYCMEVAYLYLTSYARNDGLLGQ